MPIDNKLMNRHQFDRRNAQQAKVIQHRRAGQAGIGTPQFRGYAGVTNRHALDVEFIDDSFVPRDPRRFVALPVETGIDDDSLGNERRAVPPVLAQIGVWVTYFVSKESVVPLNRSI